MTAWTDNIVQRMGERSQGKMPGKPPEGDWPALPATRDDITWESAKQRLFDAVAGLRTHIETFHLATQLERGNVGYSQLADLLCRLTHNAYHIGQITKLHQWYAAQTPP